MSDVFRAPAFTISLPQAPANKGHLTLTTQSTSLAKEQRDLLHDFFFMASYGATALFELVRAQGSNVIIRQTADRIQADVIARFENDGLNFMWQPTQANPAELDDLAKKIRDTTDELVWAQEHKDESSKKPTSPVASPVVLKQEPVKQEKEAKINYLLRSLRRRP